MNGYFIFNSVMAGLCWFNYYRSLRLGGDSTFSWVTAIGAVIVTAIAAASYG